MKTYFDKASQGMVDTQLFVVMLKSNFEKILAQAFDEEMILLTIDKISSKNWLLDPTALLNYMDLELLNLISSKQLALVLEKLKKPQHFYEEVMKNLISKECPNVETEWAIFSDRLKRTVTAAASASASVDSGRAKKFLSELHLQGFQGGFRDNFLGKKFTTDSEDTMDVTMKRKKCSGNNWPNLRTLWMESVDLRGILIGKWNYPRKS